MKSAALALCLAVTSSAFAATESDSAYTALRVVGKLKGQEVLNRVIELRGRNGVPQPAVWTIVLSEPSARGGIREIEVQRGKVIGERTPTARGSGGQSMDFNRLNLDSEGVFTVVNQEAQQQGQPFDRVDYALRSGSGGGAPVWTADLFDGVNGKVASMQIAADSGTILGQTKSRATGAPTPPPPVSDRDFVTGNPPPPDPRDGAEYQGPPSTGGYSRSGEKFRGVGDFFHRLGDRVHRRGGQLENFFTGKKGGSDSDR